MTSAVQDPRLVLVGQYHYLQSQTDVCPKCLISDILTRHVLAAMSNIAIHSCSLDEASVALQSQLLLIVGANF